MSAPCRILMVEDDPEQRKVFSMLLASAGYQITTAEDAETALSQLTRGGIDVVLSDWMLPGMNGDALIEAVHQQKLQVKTVLMSNRSDVQSAARACAADGWVRKHDDFSRWLTVLDGLSQIKV